MPVVESEVAAQPAAVEQEIPQEIMEIVEAPISPVEVPMYPKKPLHAIILLGKKLLRQKEFQPKNSNKFKVLESSNA